MRYNRVLIILPSYPGSFFSSSSYLDAGVGYVSESLNVAGIDNVVFDMSLYPDRDKLMSQIQKFNPDLIGITMRSLNFKRHYALVAEIRQRFPHIHIVAGGPHISTFREKALHSCPELDYGVVLEGEQTIVELCKDTLPLSEIWGLIYRNRKSDGGIAYNGDRPFCHDLDFLPLPTYSRFELSRYKCSIPIVSSRGCPFQCIFCPVKKTIGHQYRARNPVLVAEEVEWWYQKGYREFDFTDDNFTLIPNRVYQFCDEIARRNLKHTIFSCGNGIRADKVDRYLLTKMKQSGFYQLSFGVEAGNNQILKNIKKGETIEEIEHAIATACELGFLVRLTFLLGSPGETWKDIQDSIKVALKYPVWKFNFFNLIPFPGTELYDWITTNNYWVVDQEEYLNEIDHWTNKPAFETPELSCEKRIQAYELTHKLMITHWEKSDRNARRLVLHKRLEMKGLPTTAARFLSGMRYNDLMPAIDKRLPWFSRGLRTVTYPIRKMIS